MASTVDLGSVVGPTGPTGPTGPNYSSLVTALSIKQSESDNIYYRDSLFSNYTYTNVSNALSILEKTRVSGFITSIKQLNMASFQFDVSPFAKPAQGSAEAIIPEYENHRYATIHLGSLNNVVVRNKLIFPAEIVFITSIGFTTNIRSMYLSIESGIVDLIFDPISSGPMVITYTADFMIKCNTPYLDVIFL